MMSSRLKIAGLALLVMLSACGEPAISNIPPQQWEGMLVQVETRPSPPEVGMDEVLVVVTEQNGKPGSDIMVSLRSSDHDQWIQAIEDGGLGVYRRAVVMAPGERSVLQVQLKRNGRTNVLRFQLKVKSN
jgi:hypothetical protein